MKYIGYHYKYRMSINMKDKIIYDSKIWINP